MKVTVLTNKKICVTDKFQMNVIDAFIRDYKPLSEAMRRIAYLFDAKDYETVAIVKEPDKYYLYILPIVPDGRVMNVLGVDEITNCVFAVSLEIPVENKLKEEVEKVAKSPYDEHLEKLKSNPVNYLEKDKEPTESVTERPESHSDGFDWLVNDLLAMILPAGCVGFGIITEDMR